MDRRHEVDVVEKGTCEMKEVNKRSVSVMTPTVHARSNVFDCPGIVAAHAYVV